MLLLGSVILALSGHAQAEQVAIEPQAGFGIGDRNGGVVYSEEQTIALPVPFGIPFVFGELQDFERMLVRILEIERLDSSGIFVPIRQPLGTGRRILDFVLAQDLVGAIHIADD